MQPQLCKLGWTFLLESREEGKERVGRRREGGEEGRGWGGGWKSKPSAAICVTAYVTPEEMGKTDNLHRYCSQVIQSVSRLTGGASLRKRSLRA